LWGIQTQKTTFRDLEKSITDPMTRLGRWTAGGWNKAKIRRLEMLGTIARWGHNTLLIALAFMTLALFFLFR
jgi:hypothetical protein